MPPIVGSQRWDLCAWLKLIPTWVPQGAPVSSTNLEGHCLPTELGVHFATEIVILAALAAVVHIHPTYLSVSPLWTLIPITVQAVLFIATGPVNLTPTLLHLGPRGTCLLPSSITPPLSLLCSSACPSSSSCITSSSGPSCDPSPSSSSVSYSSSSPCSSSPLNTLLLLSLTLTPLLPLPLSS